MKNQVEITKKISGQVGLLFKLIKERGERTGEFDGVKVGRFILRCILAMFAENTRMLPKDIFINLIHKCLKDGDPIELIGGLFAEMNTPGIKQKGTFKGVDYFGGSLFEKDNGIYLNKEELKILEKAALEDWSNIKPSIFGNVFEAAINKEERRSHGIHYTSEADIMKVVGPTIGSYWQKKIDAANKIKELEALKYELQNYKVLDPACGSGNFLYVAYQELKLTEQLLLGKIAEISQASQLETGFVTPLQFYGIDNNPFSVEIAKVTMAIARKVVVNRLGLNEPVLPLDVLDNNLVCADALFTEWPKVDAIIGNPPFLGGSTIGKNLGYSYKEKLKKNFKGINGKADFCCYWFRLAHEKISSSGRAGFVGTNSISQNNGRDASLGFICNNEGYIHNAVSSQPWSGEANVHVSIVNWSKKKPEVFILDNEEVKSINSSLTTGIDVSGVKELKANTGVCFQGIITNGKGFEITPEQAKSWIEKDVKNKEVLKPFVGGDTLSRSPNGKPKNWVIDFNQMPLEEASEYELPFNWVLENVKPERQTKKDERLRNNWWLFERSYKGLRSALEGLSFYFGVSQVSKWTMPILIKKEFLPDSKVISITSEDFYVLGILTSDAHRQWVKAQGSTLKSSTSYTAKTCFRTFPFPQTDEVVVDKIRQTAIELHEYRYEQMEKKQWGMTTLYNKYFDETESQLYKLHKKLDALVLEAYDFSPDDDILEKLFLLNRELKEKEENLLL